MAMEYYSFDKVLTELQMEEDELKRLVSEGEIRAIRGENNTMMFRKEEIERLKQDTGKTIQYTEESSDTLTDDLLFDEADDLDVDEEGMATAQISSEDTFVGDDTGMTTAPLAASAPAPKTAACSSGGGASPSASFPSFFAPSINWNTPTRLLQTEPIASLEAVTASASRLFARGTAGRATRARRARARPPRAFACGRPPSPSSPATCGVACWWR